MIKLKNGFVEGLPKTTQGLIDSSFLDIVRAITKRNSDNQYAPYHTSEFVTALTSGVSDAFAGGVLLPDGRVFCVPVNASNAKIYDPVTNTQSTTALTSGGSLAFFGGVLLPDGRVFCVPV
jgi:hypothetical protein